MPVTASVLCSGRTRWFGRELSSPRSTPSRKRRSSVRGKNATSFTITQCVFSGSARKRSHGTAACDLFRLRLVTERTASMYRSLDSEKILGTIGTLGRRIEGRFPGAGLGKVCQELFTIAEESQRRSAWIAKPQSLLRFIIGALVTI